jgi:hypothetical protein
MSSTLTNGERVILPQDLVPVHYNLEISPDFDQLVFVGNEEVSKNLLLVVLKQRYKYVYIF